MLLLSSAGTEETSEGEQGGRVQYVREGQTEMKIASFKQVSILWALSPKATTHTKRTLCIHQGLMGKVRGKFAQCPERDLAELPLHAGESQSH